MRIGKVVGKLSLSKAHPSLKGRRWIIVVPFGLQALMDKKSESREELIVVDDLGATPDSWIGFTEGMEATFPYLPDRKPLDAYVACIIDEIELDEQEVSQLHSISNPRSPSNE